MHIDEFNPCGHDAHLTCINFGSLDGPLENGSICHRRSVLLVWFKGGKGGLARGAVSFARGEKSQKSPQVLVWRVLSMSGCCSRRFQLSNAHFMVTWLARVAEILCQVGSRSVCGRGNRFR